MIKSLLLALVVSAISCVEDDCVGDSLQDSFNEIPRSASFDKAMAKVNERKLGLFAYQETAYKNLLAKTKRLEKECFTQFTGKEKVEGCASRLVTRVDDLSEEAQLKSFEKKYLQKFKNHFLFMVEKCVWLRLCHKSPKHVYANLMFRKQFRM